MCVSPIRIRQPTKGFVSVPCGHCVECLERKRNDWSLRLQNELRFSSKFCYFITLTYNDLNVPLIFDSFDNIIGFTLCKDDLKAFIRSLRDRIRYYCKSNNLEVCQLRYFAVGEYGSKFLRPHYHLMLFNFPFDYDLTYKFLSQVWNKGFIQLGYLKNGGCHYQAKYMIKPSGICDLASKPFLLCSKGIGKSYLNNEIIKFHRFNDNVSIIGSRGSRFSLPRYYRDKIWQDKVSKDALSYRLKLNYTKYVNDVMDQFDNIESYEINRQTFISRKEQRLFKLTSRKL